ncbi:MAG: hypothetical protein GMKNLPBB_00104 [Myxococcota bacterium]|nr:hypothetical protein [Myxococcota bacterium]
MTAARYKPPFLAVKSAAACLSAVCCLSAAPALSGPASPAVIAAPATAASGAAPENWDAWLNYQKQRESNCVGPFDTLDPPARVTVAGRRFVISGHRMVEENQKGKTEVAYGVVSTLKEAAPGTIYNLKKFIQWWKSKNVDAIIVGGDIANGEDAMEKNLLTFARTGTPVFIIMGNNDSRGQFNRAVRTITWKYHNVFNMNMIRFFDGDGADIMSLPGYYDRQFTRNTASCLYKDADVDAMEKLPPLANSPLLFLTHGPPKMTKPTGIDVIHDKSNVGDYKLTEFIKGTKGKINFGVHGHIIEAGGRASDLIGNPVAPGVWAPQVFLNPSQGDSFPWKMLDGSTNQGMAAILRINVKTRKASYEILRIGPDEHADLDEDTYANEFDELEELRRGRK